MKTIKSISFSSRHHPRRRLRQRGDETGTGPDAGTPDTDGGADLTVDPPAESASWACRSGVDAEGNDYMEFNRST